MRKFIITAILILLLIPIFTEAENKTTDLDTLHSIMNSFDGKFMEADISANGIIAKKYLENDQLEELAVDIREDLGLLGLEGDLNQIPDEDYYIRQIIDDEEYKQSAYFGYDKDGNEITFILSSYINSEDHDGETYLYINHLKRDNSNDKNDIIDIVKNIFARYDEKAEITTCLIGTLDGKLSEKDIEEKVTKILKKLDGNIVDEYKDDYLVSYTAYTDTIEDSILVGNENINLNIALRYNDFKDMTLIWIGTPIISSGY